MRPKLQGLVTCLVLFSASMPLVAHHSFAVDYDVKKPVKLQGTVTMVQWTNPHAHVYLDVVENGVKTNWNFEMASPNILERNGWSRKALSVNDQVTVEGYSGRVVTTRGFLTSITLSDGRKLFASPGPGTDAPYQ
jgi:Family of unknown function (DUF6152)